MINKFEKSFGPPKRREGVKKDKLLAINFIYAAFKLLLQKCFLDYKKLKLLIRTRKATKEPWLSYQTDVPWTINLAIINISCGKWTEREFRFSKWERLPNFWMLRQCFGDAPTKRFHWHWLKYIQFYVSLCSRRVFQFSTSR